MRRTYISPEFDYSLVFGTYNMEEESSFFGSKMLEIEDSLSILKNNILYYQNLNNEQIDESKEKDLPAIVYSATDDKKINHTLILDDSQTDEQKETYAKWILTIDLQTILKNFVFANLKKERTFDGVSNAMTINRNVDFSIRDYIERNVLNRYKLNRVELFIVPVDLLTLFSLKYENKWDTTIESDKYKFTRFSTVTDFKYRDVKLYFNQELPANQYGFRYYYNLYYDKL